MSTPEQVSEHIDVDVENIGGIDRTSVTFDPGVTVLTGRNATNRTSLLQAIMAAHGSDNSSLKADADEGAVSVSFGDETYDRQLARENGTVTHSGNPVIDDAELADLFAFLLEGNPARRAVGRGDDLRDIIMEPVDTGAIEREIRDLEQEKQDLTRQLEELSDLEQRLPDLEAKRTRLQDRIEEKRAALEAKQDELEEADGSVDEKQETKDQLESKLDELRKTRSELDDVQYELETERDTLSSLREERDDLEAEFEELPETPAGELEQITSRLDDLHERKQSITADLDQLQTIIQFNEEMLESSDTELLASLDDDGDESSASVTDQLVDDTSAITCWTCGSTVEQSGIEEMVDELREFRKRKLEDRRELGDDIDGLQEEKRELESKQREREQLDRKLDKYERQIEQAEENIADLEARESELDERVETLESTVDELEQEEYSDLLDQHKEVTQLEVEVDRLESDLDDVESEIESVEDRLDDRASLEDQREEIQDELEDLRTTVDRLEQEAVEAFNDHMDEIRSVLGFENLERVWLERVETEVRDGRRKVSKTAFDLHIVRETNDGTVYEDTVEHLSESEREVVGLVFALAGYLVHDVYETVPFMLLDSLEAIDSDRISALVDYFADYADYLVVALLPEDAAALDEDYTRITEI